MKDILKDVKSGALPAEEIPGFIAWWIRKHFWLFLVVLIIGCGVILLF